MGKKTTQHTIQINGRGAAKAAYEALSKEQQDYLHATYMIPAIETKDSATRANLIMGFLKDLRALTR